MIGYSVPMVHHYTLYGLRVQTDFSLSFFKPAPSMEHDVRISRHSQLGIQENLSGKEWFFKVNRQQALLFFRGVASFCLIDGQEIRIVPEPGVDFRLLEQYLIGTVFGVLLYQRQLLVVHASGVALPKGDGAIIFVGESGAGKSTLSLAMQMEKGCTGLSDDVVGIGCESRPPVIDPAYPFMKLASDLASLYQIPVESLKRVPASPGEYFFPYKGEMAALESSPLRAIFVLRTGRRPCIERLGAAASVVELVRHSIPARLLHRTGDTMHFRQCTSVVEAVPMYALTRTDNLDALPEVVDLVYKALSRPSVSPESVTFDPKG